MGTLYDPALIPISRRGSWLSVAYLSGEHAPRGPGLYLRINRSRPLVHRVVMRIVPILPDGTEIALRSELEVRPGIIVAALHNNTSDLSIVFDGPTSVRVSSSSAFRLESAFSTTAQRDNAAHAVAYSESSNRYVINARVWLRKFGIEVIQGHSELDAPWDGEVSRYGDLTVRPAEGSAEASIDEIGSTWTHQPRSGLTSIVANLSSEWEEFFRPFPQAPAAEAAAGLLWMCTQGASGNLTGEAIVMSLNWMDSVWSWDNWINMVALAAPHPELAFQQFSVVAEHQDAFGAYPDAVNDGFMHFNFTKPPVQGVIIDLISEIAPAFWTRKRKEAVYESVGRFTAWWLLHRRFEGDRLCHYLHGNDSGWDNGTLLRRGVPVISPDLNAFLAYQCRVLARLAVETGLPAAEAARWNAEGDSLRNALLEELWRTDHFVARYCANGEDVDSVSLSAALPAILATEFPGDVRSALVERFRRCETHWGLASEAPDSPYYERDNYWRGPIWAPTTLIAVHALRRLGEEEFADRIARRFMRLVETSGFAENFDAESGAPLVDPAYSWTASVYLTFAGRATMQK
ncbi:MAG: amylo-alpha-1,6-glucosidase [Spirochaetota bacterium]